jgi:hypothetical protein
MAESCGSCRHLGVPEGAAIEPNGLYPCTYPVPKLPIAAVITRVTVRPTDGASCSCWATSAPRPWREVMEWPVDWGAVTEHRVGALYLRLRSIRHPDMPTGSPEAMNELDRAMEDALKEIWNG